jgi:hypothetical protein
MLATVPGGRCSFGRGSVTRPGLVGCLSCMWLTRRATSCQRSSWSSLRRSLLETEGIVDDTHQVCILQPHRARRQPAGKPDVTAGVQQQCPTQSRQNTVAPGPCSPPTTSAAYRRPTQPTDGQDSPPTSFGIPGRTHTAATGLPHGHVARMQPARTCRPKVAKTGEGKSDFNPIAPPTACPPGLPAPPLPSTAGRLTACAAGSAQHHDPTRIRPPALHRSRAETDVIM